MRLAWPFHSRNIRTILSDMSCDSVAAVPVDYDFGCSGAAITTPWSQVLPVYTTREEALQWFKVSGYDLSGDEQEYSLDQLNEAIGERCSDNDLCVPMMNYYYPVNLGDVPEKIQGRLHLYGGSCVLVMLDENPVLVLTGGGMDMTWDIVWAYVLCGNLPPTHFCRLPWQGEKMSLENRLIIEACKKSVRVHKSWLTRTTADLARRVKEMTEHGKK